MKILRVGDMHVKPSNLKESDALMEFILSQFREHKAHRLEFLGDQTDTHSIIRLEVLEFWHKWIKKLYKNEIETFMLVGNHDLSGDYANDYSSLNVFSHYHDYVRIIDSPYESQGIGYLPYIHDNQKFIEEANALVDQGATVLVSHPNFEGAVYDNGSSILGGVDPNSLDSRFLHLIGGHIHTELEMGRVWYTGNPRWLTKSCANKKKGIWLCNHDDSTGAILSKEFISTESVCTPIVSIKWNEGEDKPEIPKNAKVDVELIGSSDWVSKTKKDLIGSVSVSSKITDVKKSKERKSGKSLHEFLAMHYQADPKKKQKLIEYLGGLGLV